MILKTDISYVQLISKQPHSMSADEHEVQIEVFSLPFILPVVCCALMPPLSTPLAPDNCGKSSCGRSGAFPWDVHPKGGNYDGV